MPRAKPKRGNGKWRAGPIKLTTDAKSELLSLLGIDEVTDAGEICQRQAIDDVENILGMYAGAVEALRQLPGPPDHVLACEKIATSAQTLSQALQHLHEWTRETLSANYSDQPGSQSLLELEFDLQKLLDSARKVAEKYAKTEGRGRPTWESSSLREVIRRLRRVFDRFYTGGDRVRSVRGAVSALAESEQEEIDFIRIALDDAGIPRPRNLRPLTQHPDCALPQDRMRLIENCARKVQSARNRELDTRIADDDS